MFLTGFLRFKVFWDISDTFLTHNVSIPSEPIMKWCMSGPVDMRGPRQLFSITPLGVTIFICTTWEHTRSQVTWRTYNFTRLMWIKHICSVWGELLNELCMFVCVERQEDIPGPQCCHRCSSSCLRRASPPSRPENWTPWSPARGPYSNHAHSTTHTDKTQNNLRDLVDPWWPRGLMLPYGWGVCKWFGGSHILCETQSKP